VADAATLPDREAVALGDAVAVALPATLPEREAVALSEALEVAVPLHDAELETDCVCGWDRRY
jgi:hypothetical protein